MEVPAHGDDVALEQWHGGRGTPDVRQGGVHAADAKGDSISGDGGDGEAMADTVTEGCRVAGLLVEIDP